MLCLCSVCLWLPTCVTDVYGDNPWISASILITASGGNAATQALKWMERIAAACRVWPAGTGNFHVDDKAFPAFFSWVWLDLKTSNYADLSCQRVIPSHTEVEIFWMTEGENIWWDSVSFWTCADQKPELCANSEVGNILNVFINSLHRNERLTWKS